MANGCLHTRCRRQAATCQAPGAQVQPKRWDVWMVGGSQKYTIHYQPGSPDPKNPGTSNGTDKWYLQWADAHQGTQGGTHMVPAPFKVQLDPSQNNMQLYEDIYHLKAKKAREQMHVYNMHPLGCTIMKTLRQCGTSNLCLATIFRG